MKNESTNKELLYRIDERQAEIRKSIVAIEIHLRELNGTVSKNKQNIFRLTYALIGGSVIWIKESRDFLLTVIKSLL